MPLERSHILPNAHEHVAVLSELGFVAHWAMPWDDDCLAGDDRETILGRANHSINAATCRIVNERVESVPPSVADLKNVGFFEVHRDVAVCVSGSIVLENYVRVIKMQPALDVKYLGWKGAGRSGRKCIVPTFDPSGD